MCIRDRHLGLPDGNRCLEAAGLRGSRRSKRCGRRLRPRIVVPSLEVQFRSTRRPPEVRFWLQAEIRQSSGAEATGQILFDLFLWNTGHAPFVSGFDPGANFLIPGELDVVALGGSTDIEQSVPAPGGPGGSVRLLRM